VLTEGHDPRWSPVNTWTTVPVECGVVAGRFLAEENGGELECAARGKKFR
jgi:hypothetical protein